MSLHTAQYKFIQRDITQVFRKQFAAVTPIFPQFCTVVPSRGADESYAWIGDLPGMREWLGERKFKQLRAAGYVLPNKHWESSLEFERTIVDDDRYGVMRPAIMNLAVEARYHPDELLFMNVVNQGESQLCFDGQNFFDTDHEWGDSGVQSNIVNRTIGSAAGPTVEEWKDALDQAVLRLLSFKNDQGKFLTRPTAGTLGNLICTVPLSQYAVANKALKQAFAIEQGANSSFAATTNVLLEVPKLMPIQYTGTASGGNDLAFDLYYTGGVMKPYVFQERERLRFQTRGFDTIEEKVIKAMTEARYNAGYLAWWAAVRVKFATS